MKTTGIVMVLGLAFAARSVTPAQAPAARRGSAMTSQASGTFEVQVKPLPNDQKVEGLTVGRFAIEKQLKGDLQGTTRGEMMTTDTAVEGSGGYVAVEQVSGTLRDRSGSFTLLHQATMRNGGDFKMSLVVVPDSGTGQLAGLAGTMRIIIAGGSHSYVFEYSLPDAP